MTILVKNTMNKYMSVGGGVGPVPPPVEYMTIFNGVNSFLRLPEITLSGDFELSVVLTGNAYASTVILGNETLSGEFLRFSNQNTARIQSAGGAANIIFPSDLPTTGVFTFKVVRVSGQVTLFNNSVSSNTVNFPHDITINNLFNRVGTINYSGAAYNFIVDDGAVWNFPMNEGWSADVPRIAYNTGSGDDGQYINTVESDVIEILG